MCGAGLAYAVAVVEKKKAFAMSTSYRPQTVAIHAGQKCDRAEGSVVTPIHQTTAFCFDDASHAAKLFNLDEFGQIYSRMGNPTTDQFEARMAALDGGVGAVALASGMTAVAYAVMNICKAGDNFVTSRNVYGGVSNLFMNILNDYGIEARFVDDHYDMQQWCDKVDAKTRLFWGETLPNPRLNVFPISQVAKVANEVGVPLMIDNTCATPALCRPFEHGAHIAVYSATKYLGGHGNAIGGIVVDSGTFNWQANAARFPMLTQPDASLHGIVWTQKFDKLAYLVKMRATMLRDFGGCMAPLNGFLFTQGLETLHLRMEKHCANAQKVAEYLASHPKVAGVRYPGLEKSAPRAHAQASNLFDGNQFGPMVGVDLKGGTMAGQRFVENVQLFYHVANIGDTRSMAIHPASTTHSQIPLEARAKAGIPDGYVRLCIGIEHIDDILADLEQALEKIPLHQAA